MPHLLNDIPLYDASNKVNAVIEIPAGTNAKWTLDHQTGQFIHELQNGHPRYIPFLAYPFNYGFFPQTWTEGDNDALDAVILGSALPRGAVVPIQVVGVLHVLDRGQADPKLIGVPAWGHFGQCSSLEQVEKASPGALRFLECWFNSYKGLGILQTSHLGDSFEARQMLSDSHDAWKTRQ